MRRGLKKLLEDIILCFVGLFLAALGYMLIGLILMGVEHK